MHDTSPSQWTLANLSLPVRLTLAVFMVSVGIGYFSALVNLHFQEASPGELLPTPDDVVTAYHGKSNTGQLLRLLEAHPSLPFNGQGSMRAAFLQQKVGGWEAAVKRKGRELKLDLDNPPDRKKAEQAVLADLEGERLALIAWVKSEDEKRKATYEEDAFPLEGALKTHPITARFVEEGAAKVKSILETRCARCHASGVNGPGAQYPLESYEEIAVYFKADPSSGKSLAKLALTTHVHLLGFSVLYGMTGLLFALTGYPWIMRLGIAPLALFAQVIDISFWWLARLEAPYGPMFAQFIPVSGGIVAVALGLQILLTLFALFGKVGRVILVLLILATGAGAGIAFQQVIDPYLKWEKSQLTAKAE